MSRCCGVWLSDLSLNLIKYGWIGLTGTVFLAGMIMTIVAHADSNAPSGLYAGGIMSMICAAISAAVWICWMCKCGPCSDNQCCDGHSAPAYI
jgi:hypothetical protein